MGEWEKDNLESTLRDLKKAMDSEEGTGLTDNIDRAIRYLKKEMASEEGAGFEAELLQSAEMRTELERARLLIDKMAASDAAPIERLVNTILHEATRKQAAYIHILPGQRSSTVQLRIDGQIHDLMTVPSEMHVPLVSRWKVLADCNIAEAHTPQDGRFQFRTPETEYEVHNNFLPTIQGERVTARLVNRKQILIELDQLGLSQAHLDAISRLIERPYGFLLTAGLHNSGKTTLLYAILNVLNKSDGRRRNILTVEDPVEYRLPGLSQTAVNRKAGLIYAAALRCFLRSNPDVAYCSELRSLETAEIATELALSRCLVLTQLHVSSALLIPQRLREIGIVPFLIAQCLGGAIGQRLVRKICPHCAAEYQPREVDLQKIGLSALEDGPFRRGVGCDACLQTGFLGRIGLFEVWEVENEARRLIAESAPVEALWEATFARTGGSLWDDARTKVQQGVTTVEEAAWALFDYPIPARNALSVPISPFEI